MQFHLNGFHDGDPSLSEAANGRSEIQGDIPEELDVLIIGSGPAGLTLAAQLASYPNISTRIVEQKSGPMKRGQADGISCRSMEMFNAFGFADQVMKEGYWVNETTFWSPDPEDKEKIVRIGRVQDVEDGLSEMPHIILNQARVHDMYLDIMHKSPSRLDVDYGLTMIDLKVDPQGGDYPVTVTLKHTEEEAEGSEKTVRARYVVGCDGARSAVRNAIGRELKGDYAYQAWGVMDVLAVTDFPDFRFKTIIKSANEGSILIIPREGGYLVRIYVELDQLKQRGESKDITLERVISASNNIFKPYSIDVKDVGWWSVYEVGHSITDKFDDVPDGQAADRLPHVFIAGDACHTHSAKAGQGMNVSMGDTFNLGWKLISVLNGKSAPELLHSYSNERQAVAQDLIDFDHRWARIMSAPPEEHDETNNESPLFQKHFIEHSRFTAGLSVKYRSSALTGKDTWQNLATGFEIGTRFHSAPVIRLGDAKRVHIGDTITADTRWHLYAFSGSKNPSGPDTQISKLCDYLEHDPNSPILKHNPKGDDIDSVISICGIFQQHHHKLDFESLPSLLKPLKGCFQIKDYEKIFCPDLKTGDDIFDMRGINREKGCIVIVRPDQYVAHILPLDAYDELAKFFSGFLLDKA